VDDGDGNSASGYIDHRNTPANNHQQRDEIERRHSETADDVESGDIAYSKYGP